MKTVSVVIPAYNSAEFIHEAIESILNQDYGNIEINIVDDGSTDSTRDALNTYIESNKIRYFYQDNAGPGAARNRGIKESTGEYICFLDADDILLPNSIAKRLYFMQQHPEVGLVFTDLYRCRSKGDLSEVHFHDNGFLKKFASAINDAHPPEYVLNSSYVSLAFEHSPFIKTPTVMLKKSIIEKVGGFDRSLRAAEDIDLWLRIAREFSIGYIDEPLTCWHNFQSTLTADTSRFFADTIVFYKNQLNSSATKPDEIKKLRHRLGRLFFSYGFYECQQGHRVKARRLFFQSLEFLPFKMKTWKNIGISFLPDNITSYLLVLKNKLVRHE